METAMPANASKVCSVLSKLLVFTAIITILRAQTPQELDQQIRNLANLAAGTRMNAIEDLVSHIRGLPQPVRFQLAFNLAIATGDDDGPQVLQDVTTVFADSLRDVPAKFKSANIYEKLAELARYSHMQVSLDDPRYLATLAKFEAEDLRLAGVDFTLASLDGKQWRFSSMRGNIVLVNFWATWCGPCKKELPDLQAIHDPGVIVVGITTERDAVVRKFTAKHEIRFPVLLDCVGRVTKLFAVRGIPRTFVFDREGKLAGQLIGSSSQQKFEDLIAHAQHR
jgi:peroxiredoxin